MAAILVIVLFPVHAKNIEKRISSQIKKSEDHLGRQLLIKLTSRRQEQWGGQGYFVENVGQIEHPDVRYYTKIPKLEVGFAEGRVYFNAARWRKRGGDRNENNALLEHIGGVVFALKIGEGSVKPEPQKTLSGYSNYLIGSNPENWHTYVKHFERILYREVYPGIDLAFFFNKKNQLTYEYVVSPGADPPAIALRYEGIEGIEPRKDGGMDIWPGVGRMTDSGLLSFQQKDGKRQIVASAFFQKESDSYSIELLEEYDRSRQLVIDPILSFSTFWGTPGGGHRSVVVDAAGNVYASGGAASTSWPTTLGAYDTKFGGGKWGDIVAAKFDPTGKVIWSTYIGGSGEEIAYVSAVNGVGELYLSGRAGSGFPTTPGAFDSTFNGGIVGRGRVHGSTDAYLLKLSADGSKVLFSTYIGGSGNENGRAIHLLPSSEVVVGGGNGTSTDLPITQGAVRPNFQGAKDGWVAKVTADGGGLVFLTYWGGINEPRQGDDTIRALGADASGNIWIGGTTRATSLGFSTTPDAFQPVRGGGRNETYIAKISPDGKKLIYLSWLGGSGFEEIETEGVSDDAGNFYIAGATSSPDFPVTPGAFQSKLKGAGGRFFDGDAWVARINNDGSLGFSTLFGGSRRGYETFFGPVVDKMGNVYCTGRFISDNCPVTPNALQPTKSDPGNKTMDAFLAVFSPDGKKLLYGSYFGGTDHEIGRHIGIHPDGSSVYITGETRSTDIPLVNAAQTKSGGGFLVKFDVTDISAPSAGTTQPNGQRVF
jgi:hypothetical protein